MTKNIKDIMIECKQNILDAYNEVHNNHIEEKQTNMGFKNILEYTGLNIDEPL